MKNIDKIYRLASQDARTESIPTRDSNGTMIFNLGQREILTDSNNDNIRSQFSELSQVKTAKKDVLNSMLSQEQPFKKEAIIFDDSTKNLKDQIEVLKSSIELAKEEAKQEEDRQLARGYTLPEKPTKIKKLVIKKIAEKSSFSDRAKRLWQKIKRVVYAILIIILLESFFGLAQWNILRDQKSLIQVLLRIASSSVLVITLHLAEKKFKDTGLKIFAAYIIFGIMALIILLIGSLILGYIHPQYLESYTNTADFSLTDKIISGTANIGGERGIVGFFMQYDFIIGLITLIVYMLINFLDRKSLKKVKIDNEEAHKKEAFIEQKDPTDLILTNMYEKLLIDENKFADLSTKLEQLKAEPSALLSNIQGILFSSKADIEKYDTQIADLENSIEAALVRIEQDLLQYQTDFISAFKNKPAAHFVTPQWPNREDINTYYRLI